MAEQNFNPNAPAFARSSPKAYYAWLTSQGLPHAAAYQQTTSIFGSPKSPGQIEKEKADAAQTGGLVQVGGAVLGAVAANEALRGFPNVKGAFTPAEAPNMAPSGTIGLTRAAPPSMSVDGSGATLNIDATAPKVIASQGTTSTVELPTGGTQTVPTEALNDPGFWSNVNWGQVAQGGLALAQMYTAYKSFQKGDKLGGGLGMAAGAGNLAASGALGAGAQTAAGELGGGYLIPGLNLAMGAYGAYKTAEMTGEMAAGKQRDVGAATSGAMAGAAIGSVVPILGTAVGAAVGALAGYAGSKFAGSSKRKPQVMRDNIRQVLQQNNILDENFQGTLADGSKYDFGKDGSTLKWSNIDKIAKAQPTAWGAAVPAADALAASYGFVGQKASDLAAWYAKGAVSNSGDDANIALKNMQHFAKQQGITFDLVKGKLDQALNDKRITQDKYNYYVSGAQQLVGGSSASPAVVQRAEKGKVVRQSPGLYRDDKGRLVAGNSMKIALSNAYQKQKEKENGTRK